MTDEINLGDLEFKAEDFVKDCCCGGVGCNGDQYSDTANRILREKLAKARKVSRNNKVGCYHQWTTDTECEHCKDSLLGISQKATHTGRLVCVEPIKQ